MDQLVARFQKEHNLSAQDMRLLNWHFANLEYANAVNVSELSLGGWDQDSGNEFEGRHSEIIGGYSQVVRGLFQIPNPLDVRLKKVVKHVDYQESVVGRSARPMISVKCEDGEMIMADHVVSTLSLGILQTENNIFNPSLPPWKREAIGRLGFGVLNKVLDTHVRCLQVN